jgi:hypothetical protein
MKPLVPALILALVGGAAQAALHPKYYEEGRRSAANVIVLKVSKVEPPQGPLGDCQVHGKVETVERGQRYQVGENVVIAVDCVRPGAETPSSGILYQDSGEVAAAPRGRAFLDKAGAVVMSQYELLP